MLPPPARVKKCMPRLRSSASRVQVTVRAGNANTIRTLAHSAVQVKIGMRISVIPGARRRRIVTTKLMPVSVLPAPLTSTAQIQ